MYRRGKIVSNFVDAGGLMPTAGTIKGHRNLVSRKPHSISIRSWLWSQLKSVAQVSDASDFQHAFLPARVGSTDGPSQ